MTASAPVPAAVTPISGSRQVASLQCPTISCAVCDLTAAFRRGAGRQSLDSNRGLQGGHWQSRLAVFDAAPLRPAGAPAASRVFDDHARKSGQCGPARMVG